MPGNSQRKGAVRKKGKTTPAGSGGRVRRGLEGKGPTPRAEDRPYHKAYRKRGPNEAGKTTGAKPKGRASSRASAGGTATAGADWVIGRNPVLEALQAGLPIRRAYVADGVERDDRLRDILTFAAEHGIPLLQATRPELDRLTGGGVPPQGACNTWRALFAGTRKLAEDLQEHMHIENNILFPRFGA